MRTSIRTKSHVCFFSIIGLLLVLVTNPAPALAGSSFLPVILKNYDGSNPPPTPSQPPTAPTNVSATDGAYTDKVRVSWTASAGATGYKVFRHTEDNSGVATEIGTAANSSYDDTGAVVGTTYYYWAKATNGLGDSGFSNGDSGYRVANLVPPTAPANLAASDGAYTDKVRVSWTASAGATGYKVFRHTANDSAVAVQIGTAAVSPYDDAVAVVGTTYYYWVKATNGAGDSGFSNEDSGHRVANFVPPTAPTSVSATDGAFANYVRLTWTAALGATGYKVFRHTANNSAAAAQIGTGANSPYDDTGSVSGTTYYYWVKATNGGGDSGFSNGDSGYRATANLAPPSNLTAFTITTPNVFGIGLDWIDNSNNETGLEIQEGKDQFNFQPTNTYTAPANSIWADIKQLEKDTYYCYRVRAQQAGVNSAFTNTACAWTQADVPPRSPTEVTAKAISDTTVLVNWTNNSYADKYNVCGLMDPDHNQNWGCFDVNYANIPGVNVTQLAAGQIYQWKVSAHNSKGFSAYSAISARVSTPGSSSTPKAHITNNTAYPIISLKIDNGVELFPQSPQGIPPGASIDLPVAAGVHTYQATNGFWSEASRFEMYHFTNSWSQPAGTYNLSIPNPSIDRILTKFGSSRQYLGEYWSGTNFHYQGFRFYSPGNSCNFYRDGNHVGPCTYALVSYPGSYTVTFSVTVGGQTYNGYYSETGGNFYMRNGPADWPVIYYNDAGN